MKEEWQPHFPLVSEIVFESEDHFDKKKYNVKFFHQQKCFGFPLSK